MPWKIAKSDSGDKWCVHKETADGGIGEQVACHDSEAEAKQQMAALYAQEPAARAVRMVEGSDDIIEGLGMPFGGPFNGQDLYGEHFSIKTDFALPWFSERPALYHHGLDSDAGIAVVGRVKTHEVKADLGVWAKVQLDKSSEYFSAIKDLVKQGKLFFSSGAMAHLVDVDKRSGEIKRWPWVELSLTPTPANLLATVDFATAKAHLKAAGLELPDGLKAVSMAMMRQMAADMDVEMSDAEMQAMMNGHPEATEAEMRKLIQKKAAKSASSLKAVSWEKVRQEASALLDRQFPKQSYPVVEMSGYGYVTETFADHVIACICKGGEEKYYSIPYTLDEDGHVSGLGELQEVESTYKPIKPARSAPTFADIVSFLLDDPGLDMEPVPIGFHAETVTHLAASLAQRTKDLGDRRLKERRRISDANRKRFATCMEQMGAAMREMQTLLDSSMPAPKGTEGRTVDMAVLRRQADSLRLFAASLPQN